VAGVVGDFAALALFEKRLATLGKRGTRDAVKAMAAEASDLVAEGFRQSTAPSGTPWRPLAKARARNRRRGDSGKPLLDTGRLRASVTTAPRISGDGFVITADPIYAATHQYGRGPIPPRPFLPIPDLPASWAVRLSDAAHEAIDAIT
jgi:phage gpG-like protein